MSETSDPSSMFPPGVTLTTSRDPNEKSNIVRLSEISGSPDSIQGRGVVVFSVKDLVQYLGILVPICGFCVYLGMMLSDIKNSQADQAKMLAELRVDVKEQNTEMKLFRDRLAIVETTMKASRGSYRLEQPSAMPAAGAATP